VGCGGVRPPSDPKEGPPDQLAAHLEALREEDTPPVSRTVRRIPGAEAGHTHGAVGSGSHGDPGAAPGTNAGG